MSTAPGFDVFAAALERGGGLDIAAMTPRQYAALATVAFSAESSLEDCLEHDQAETFWRSLDGTTNIFCSGDAQKATTLAEGCIGDEAGWVRVIGVNLLRKLHLRVSERAEIGDGSTEATIWAQLVRDSDQEVSLFAMDCLGGVVHHLAEVANERNDVRPVYNALKRVLGTNDLSS